MTQPPLRISPSAGGIRLQVRVVPRASRSAVAGVREGRLIVRVTAPPVDGAANDAVVEMLSTVLQVPRRAITIVVGQTGRDKTVAIEGVTESLLRQRLQL
jgi:uncharacterized protein (TIGR00251 family)